VLGLVPGVPRPGRRAVPQSGSRPGANSFSVTIGGTGKSNNDDTEVTAAKVGGDMVSPDIAADPRGRDPGDRLPGQSGESSRKEPTGPGSVHELLRSWDALRKMVPAGEKPVPFLASRTHLKPSAISQLQRTRNQCAHPGESGWPGPYDIDMATATARELLRQLEDS
jgi:hypothetical protein